MGYDTLLLRRLTTQELACANISPYEPIVNSDTMELLIGQGIRGALIPVGRVRIGSIENRPAPGQSGRMYYVNSGENVNILFLDNGLSWIKLNENKLTVDQIIISDTKGFVNPNDVDDENHVIRIWAGVHAINATDILAHLGNLAIHTKINDVASNTTETWSSFKIKSGLDSLSSALGNDPNFSDTIIGILATKVDKVPGKQLSTNDYTAVEKDKLAGVENNANNYTHPSTHPVDIIVTTSEKRFITDELLLKLSNIEEQANKYIHPTSHSANMISVTDDRNFVSLTEKAAWNAKAEISDIDTRISEIIDNSPLVLDTLSELANALGNDPNFAVTITNALTYKVDKVPGKQLSTNDYTDADRDKLLGIEDNANKYIHPDMHPASIIETTPIRRFISDELLIKLVAIEEGANNYVHPTGDGNLHVPATGVFNEGKFLKSGSQEGDIFWESISSVPKVINKTTDLEDVTLLDAQRNEGLARVHFFGSTSEESLEIATSNTGVEPIYVRQYSGDFDTLIRSVALLNDTGNTEFPGSVTASKFITQDKQFGTATFSGNKVATVIPHNLSKTPDVYYITPIQDANGYLGEYWVTVDATNLYVYSTGSATTQFRWVAEVCS